MDLELKGKVVLITGGSNGIGAAMTRGSAGEGAIPVIVDVDSGGESIAIGPAVRGQGLRLHRCRPRKRRKLLTGRRGDATAIWPDRWSGQQRGCQ